MLKQKFNPESSWASSEAALEGRKRKSNETLDKYMSELRSLARTAHPIENGTHPTGINSINEINTCNPGCLRLGLSLFNWWVSFRFSVLLFL